MNLFNISQFIMEIEEEYPSKDHIDLTDNYELTIISKKKRRTFTATYYTPG